MWHIFPGCSFLKKAAPIKPLNEEDKLWFLQHTKREEKEILAMYKQFYTDYPEGGIFRP